MRAFDMLVGLAEQPEDLVELSDIYARLTKAGQRQLLGRAYELLCNQPDGDAVPRESVYDWLKRWIEEDAADQICPDC